MDTIVDKARLNESFLAECTPGYYNNEGKPSLRAREGSFYGGGSVEYFRLLADWRASGTLPGLELRAGSAEQGEAVEA